MPVYHHLHALRVIADADPERVLLISPQHTRTASELRDIANRLAGYLVDSGLGHRAPVALMMCNRSEALESFYAALALGSPPANVNPRYKAVEVAHVVNDCQAGVLIYESSAATEAEAAVILFDHPVTLLEIGSAQWDRALAHEPAPERQTSTDDRILIYTGGTTGMPRAVEWEVSQHYQMIWGMVRRDIEAPAPEVTLARGRRAPTALPCSPFLHGVGLSLTFNTINGGGTVVFSGESSFDASVILQLVDDNDVAVVGIVGDAFARPLLHALETGAWDGRLSRLKAISSAGAAWSTEVREAMAALLPHTKLISNFGSTEALVARDMTNSEPFVPDGQVLIVDDERRPVAPGEVGLLATGGHLPIGYLGEPEKSARTFPIIDGVRYAVMGDEARQEPDGRITILGRGSSVINTGGEKVWPEEVESVLRSHSAISDVVVVGRKDERWGQRVVAVMELRPAVVVADKDFEQLCKTKLAAYKCPKVFVRLPSVPRTPIGKPDYPNIHAALDSTPVLQE